MHPVSWFLLCYCLWARQMAALCRRKKRRNAPWGRIVDNVISNCEGLYRPPYYPGPRLRSALAGG